MPPTSLLAAAQIERAKKGGVSHGCGYRRSLEGIQDAKLRKELEAIMADRSYSAPTIIAACAQFEIHLSKHQIGDHRNGTCACVRGAK